MGFLGLGKVIKGIGKGINKVGGGAVKNMNKTAKKAVMKGGIGPTQGMMSKLSAMRKK